MLKKLVLWFVKSSADPEKLALTLKAGIPFVVAMFAYFSLTIEVQDLINLLNQLIIVGTGALTAYGIIRKIVLTIKNGGIKPPQ